MIGESCIDILHECAVDFFDILPASLQCVLQSLSGASFFLFEFQPVTLPDSFARKTVLRRASITKARNVLQIF